MAEFSIIVPCYNLEPWIRACLDSVSSQDFQSWECIAVDDGSRDATGAILDDYAARDVRFKVIHQSNQGEGAARNTGLAHATGDWIFFLDGDDLMLPGTLSHLSQFIPTTTSPIIRFDYTSFSEEVPEAPADSNIYNSNIQTFTLSTLYSYLWQHLYRRDLLAGLQFKSYRRGCDRVFLIDVLLHRANSLAVTSWVGYGYRQREGSAVNSIPDRQVLLDEMDHRIDIIKMLSSVDYAGDYWLEGYLLFGILGEFRHHPDARSLRTEWLSRLRSLVPLARYSPRGRFILWCWLHPPFSLLPYFRYVLFHLCH